MSMQSLTAEIPVETVFHLHVRPDHYLTGILKDLGLWGHEAAVLWDGRLLYSQRFAFRDLAEAWARSEQQAIEADASVQAIPAA